MSSSLLRPLCLVTVWDAAAAAAVHAAAAAAAAAAVYDAAAAAAAVQDAAARRTAANGVCVPDQLVPHAMQPAAVGASARLDCSVVRSLFRDSCACARKHGINIVGTERWLVWHRAVPLRVYSHMPCSSSSSSKSSTSNNSSKEGSSSRLAFAEFFLHAAALCAGLTAISLSLVLIQSCVLSLASDVAAAATSGPKGAGERTPAASIGKFCKCW